MERQLHPDAAENFNQRAEVLFAQREPEDEEVSELPTHTFRPGAHVVASFSEGDYSAFNISGKRNALGKTTAKYFEHEGSRYGLEDEKYQELARLSESIQRTPAFREVVSTEWVEDTIIDWMKTKHAGEEVSALADYLVEQCEQDVADHELWFPISRLSVETDLQFGSVIFKTISKDMLDRMEEDLQGGVGDRGDEYAAQMQYYAQRQRSELQSLAAATIKVNAEPKRAFQVALRESELAVAALSVYQVAATTMPEVTSYCAVLGRENVESIKHLEVENGRVVRTTDKDLGKPVLHWHLSEEDVSRFRKSLGFDNVSDLLTLDTRTGFQEALLDALLLYSRSTREKDLAGRLVYMLVAMESFLLKSDNEPIQQAIGERMAFVVGDTANERQDMAANLRKAYSLRSKFVHHGQTIEEVETIRQFMLNTWRLFTQLAKISKRFTTKEELIEALEARKWS
ncbi:MAG: HEPN domain-containing protein [Chloroflexota bacterium]|nr:HEPN domain-containing protein [Chloroflexota bacterium]